MNDMQHIFDNQIALELPFLTTFGLSVKDDEAIGQFGSGLKYAIAVILRGGGTIRINTDQYEATFHTENATIRGKSVDMVWAAVNEHVSGNIRRVDMPFSLDALGKSWKPWMAFRELYCNALDEHGEYHRHDDKPIEHEEFTRITVQWSKFDELVPDLPRYFLDQRTQEPISSAEAFSVYEKLDAKGKVYMKGILVAEDANCVYDYNIETVDGYRSHLSEERTLKNAPYIVSEVIDALARDKCDAVLRNVLSCDANATENLCTYYYVADTIHYLCDLIDRYSLSPNGSLRERTLGERVKRAATEASEISGDWRLAKLKEALAFVNEMGIVFPEGVKFLVAEKPVKGVYGLYDKLQCCVILPRETLEGSQRMLVCTLIEEWTHAEHNVKDCTIEQQHVYINQMVDTYTRLTGVIL